MIAALAAATLFLQPPATYRGDWSGNVRFMRDPVALHLYCAEWIGPYPAKGRYYLSCYIPQLNTMVLPEPCGWRDTYAKLACHEKGHGLGWRH